MAGSKIVVIGSSNMDLVVNVVRQPVAGETVMGQSFFVNPGGKGANQAVAVKRLGGDVTFVTKIGKDLFGQQLQAHYADEKMDLTYVLADEKNPTGVALITVEEHGENRIVVVSGANAGLDVAELDFLRPLIDQCDYILLQLEIPLTVIGEVVRLAREARKRLVLNPAPAMPVPDDWLDGLFLITPNETEAEKLTGIRVADEDGARQAAACFLAKGVRNVVITLGERGALVASGEAMTLVPAGKVRAVDTTAAGDVFNGALVVALAEGRSLRESARWACAASAIAVTRKGAQESAPYRDEVDNLFGS